MNEKEKYFGIVEMGSDINVSYDDMPVGTPVFAGHRGGCVVQVPIKKEEEIKFKDKIEKLKSTIKYQNELFEELYPKLKRKYRKRYKWLIDE